MEYRRLGSTGLKVSVLGLGTNSFGTRIDIDQASRLLNEAIGMGVNFFDTANVYGAGKSEEFIGKALKGAKRHQAVIATKFGYPSGAMPMTAGPNKSGGSRALMMQAVEDSLKRLETDYIDVYYLHRFDPETPIEETMRSFDDLIRQGKIRYAAASNFAAWQLCNANWTARHHNLNQFACVQNAYNLIRREMDAELVPYCKSSGIGFVPFYPLAAGMLTGKYKEGQPPPSGSRLSNAPNTASILTDRNYRLVKGLEAFAQARGRTIGELAIAWLIANPTVSSIIAGATKPEQVKENAKGLDWKLSPTELLELDKLSPISA